MRRQLGAQLTVLLATFLSMAGADGPTFLNMAGVLLVVCTRSWCEMLDGRMLRHVHLPLPHTNIHVWFRLQRRVHRRRVHGQFHWLFCVWYDNRSGAVPSVEGSAVHHTLLEGKYWILPRAAREL